MGTEVSTGEAVEPGSVLNAAPGQEGRIRDWRIYITDGSRWFIQDNDWGKAPERISNVVLEAKLINFGLAGLTWRIGKITEPWQPDDVLPPIPDPVLRRSTPSAPNPVQVGNKMQYYAAFATNFSAGGQPVPSKYGCIVVFGPGIEYGPHALEGVQSPEPLLNMSAPIDPTLRPETGADRVFYWLFVDLDEINPTRAPFVYTPVLVPLVGDPARVKLNTAAFICG